MNTLTPTIGSNQFVTKFDEQAKAKKRKFKIRVSWKIKLGIIVLLIASLWANEYLLRTNYVLNCDITIGNIVQEHAGHLMARAKCDQLNQNWIDAQNYNDIQNSKLMN